MLDEPWRELGSMMSALAADSLRIQQKLDAAAMQSRAQFAALLEAVPPGVRSLLAPLAPAGLRLTEYRVDCTLRVTAARSTAFSLVAAPINAGYHALYGTTITEQSTLSVEVRAVPARAVS